MEILFFLATPNEFMWAGSGSWWRTGKPGMLLQSTGLPRGGHDWVTELSWMSLSGDTLFLRSKFWTKLKCCFFLILYFFHYKKFYRLKKNFNVVHLQYVNLFLYGILAWDLFRKMFSTQRLQKHFLLCPSDTFLVSFLCLVLYAVSAFLLLLFNH